MTDYSWNIPVYFLEFSENVPEFSENVPEFS